MNAIPIGTLSTVFAPMSTNQHHLLKIIYMWLIYILFTDQYHNDIIEDRVYRSMSIGKKIEWAVNAKI